MCRWTKLLLVLGSVAIATVASEATVSETRSLLQAARRGSLGSGGMRETMSTSAIARLIYLETYPYWRSEKTMLEMTQSPPVPYQAYGPLDGIGTQTEQANENVTSIPNPSRELFYQSVWSFIGRGRAYVLHVGATLPGVYYSWEFKQGSNLFRVKLHSPANTDMLVAHDYVVMNRWTRNYLDAHLPNWEQHLPAGCELIAYNGSRAWIMGRLKVKAGVTMEALHAIQAQTTYTPLEEVLGTNNPITGVLGGVNKEDPPTYDEIPPEADPSLVYFYEVGEYLKANPLEPESEWIWRFAARIGLTKSGFDPSALGAEATAAIAAGAQEAMGVVMNNLQTWGFHDTTWIMVDSIAMVYVEDGQLDPINWATYCFCAKTALEPTSEGALYPYSAVALTQQFQLAGMLDGSLDYQLIFWKGLLPVDPTYGFWSVTVYDANQMLVAPPYMLGTDSDLAFTPEGLLIICTGPAYVGKCPPQNYIPTRPGATFTLQARAYLPLEPILTHTYNLPLVMLA